MAQPRTAAQILKAQILRKAAVKLSDMVSAGGILNPEQFRQFVVMVQQEQTIFKEARFEPVRVGQKVIDRVGVLDQFLEPGVEDNVRIYNDSQAFLDEEQKPTFDKIELSCFKVSGHTALSWETLRRNIEQNNFERTYIQQIANRCAFDWEDLGLNGDKTLPNNSRRNKFLRLVDGFIKKVPATQQIHWGGAVVNDNLFPALINAIPPRFRRRKSEYRFYVSHGVEMAYRQRLAARGTTGGDVWLTEDGSLKAYGIPVVPCDSMPDNEGADQNEGRILLAHPRNLIVGVEDELRIVTHYDEYRDSMVTHVHASTDVAVEEEQALAYADGVKWALGGS